MTDPLAKAGTSAPPIIGSGCTQRYDPAHLHPALGTDFPGAEALWARLRCVPEPIDNDGTAAVVDVRG